MNIFLFTEMKIWGKRSLSGNKSRFRLTSKICLPGKKNNSTDPSTFVSVERLINIFIFYVKSHHNSKPYVFTGKRIFQ